jgi:spore germination protein AB
LKQKGKSSLFSPSVDKEKKVSPFYVFFLITSVQIGIGILSFQKTIVEHAGHDAWISIIVSGLAINMIVFLLYKMLMLSNGDIVSIHKELFGKWVGAFFNVFFISYFTLLALTVTRSFMEVIQTWMFPELSIWGFNLALLPLLFYIITGGFRTVVGICFFGAVLPAYLLLIFLFPLEFADWGSLLPIFDHSIKELFNASKAMTLSYLGFSTLLVYYPYIDNPEKSHKWAHLGVLSTMLVYLFIAVISFVFFDINQIKQMIWPTLALWKIIELPFVERFEYIGLSSWLIVVIPNICLFIWSACRCGERTFKKIKKKVWLYFILITYFISSFFLQDHETITKFSEIVSKIGFYLVFIYLPLLSCLYIIVKKLRGNKWPKK